MPVPTGVNCNNPFRCPVVAMVVEELARRRTVDVTGLLRRGYSFGKKIGKGSYGNVVEAKFKDPVTELTVDLACKYVDKRKVPADFLEKFFPRELHFLTILSHPNLIRIHSIMQSGSSVFIFMRYAENGDLLGYIKKHGAVKENQTNLWFYQMAKAVNYLHTNNIAHRDLKCDNIFISEHWNIKIGDFGFTRYCSEETPPLAAHDKSDFYSDTFCGSAAYAAPEIIIGEPYDPKLADIWSMGVILSVMLYGVLPFGDSNTRRLVNDQQMRRLSVNENIKNKLSVSCLSLLDACLEPNVDLRVDIRMVLANPWVRKQVEKHKY